MHNFALFLGVSVVSKKFSDMSSNAAVGSSEWAAAKQREIQHGDPWTHNDPWNQNHPDRLATDFLRSDEGTWHQSQQQTQWNQGDSYNSWGAAQQQHVLHADHFPNPGLDLLRDDLVPLAHLPVPARQLHLGNERSQ